jgi:hypothetical protein
MFKHWMSKAQNNTSHFDKGAAHCTVMFISSSLTQKKTISVCSILSHDKIEHTMINIICLLPCGLAFEMSSGCEFCVRL